MLSGIALIVAIAALLVGGGACWFAVRASKDAASAAAAVLAQRRNPPKAETVVVPERRPEQPWRDSSPRDAPEWIRESFAKLYELIRDLQRDVQRLDSVINVGDDRVPTTYADHSSTFMSPTPAARLEGRGRAVDLRDGSIIPSRALAAPGLLLPDSGEGPALLYLNESVEIDHLAWDRWSQYFDFGSGEPYRRYRTIEPSKVAWNASAEQGQLVSRGRAEAVQ
jgi:hypothetical protein